MDDVFSIPDIASSLERGRSASFVPRFGQSADLPGETIAAPACRLTYGGDTITATVKEDEMTRYVENIAREIVENFTRDIDSAIAARTVDLLHPYLIDAGWTPPEVLCA